MIVILLLLTSGVVAFSQTGDFYLSQFSPQSNDIDNQNFDIVQDRFGVIYMANRGGIVTFDGHTWELIKTPYSIFSLAIDTAKNVIYTAGKEGIGKLTRNKAYDLQYFDLLDSTSQVISDVFSLLLHQNKLYSINQKSVLIHDLKTSELKVIDADYTGDLLQLFQFENEVYVNTSISGLKRVGDKKLENPPIISLRDKNVPLLIKRPDSEEYLLGESDTSFYLYQNGQLNGIKLKDQQYLDQAEVIDGLWVNDSLVALSTLKGGVIFLNPRNGKVEQVVNYQTGLPDNEVYALSIDSNNGVWIAHSEGFTRVSPTFPFKSFNKYPGLEGKPLTVNSHNGKLFVGTTLGLFCLEEIKDYSEDVTYTKRNIKVKVRKKTNKKEEQSRKGVFRFLRRNRNGKSKSVVDSPTEYARRVVYDSVVSKNLEGIRYQYKKIPDVGSKVFQLESFNGMLLSGGLDGLYLIKDSTSEVISSLPVRYFFVSRKQQKVIINTYSDELKVFDFSRDVPREIYAFGEFKDFVQYIFEDKNDRIWLCSPDEVYWVTFEENELNDTEKYPIKNPHYFTTYGTLIRDSVIFINEQGALFFNEEKNKLQTLTYGQDLAGKYLKGPNNEVYINNSGLWNRIGAKQRQEKLDLISLFKDVSYISNDSYGNYWIITDQHELYGLSANYNKDDLSPYALYLKKARNNSKSFLPKADLKFDQDKSALSFEVAQPEYSGIMEIEYQYKLKGLPSKWSDWSEKHNIITFPYLPDGKYELLVRSRTNLGEITKMRPITFRVIPPYWKRPWFYFLEVSIIALLLFISIKIKKLGYRYRLLSRLGALLVLIIIVEFIQTVAENRFGTQSSPVLDFIIQVTMAIIILPVESVLRKYIFKEKEVKVMDFIKLKDKKKQE